MKCKHCDNNMSCIDDSGSFTSYDQRWDYYVCTRCLATASVTDSFGVKSISWGIGTYKTIEQAKDYDVEFEDGVLERFINA